MEVVVELRELCGVSIAAAIRERRIGSSAGTPDEGARIIFDGNTAEELVEAFALGLEILPATTIVGIKL